MSVAAIQARLAAGDAPGARAAADALLASAALPVADRFNALVLRSRAYEELRDLPRAILDLEGALALDGSQARLWNDLGILCADASHGERAVDAFTRATRADPAYPRGWNNLANALRAAGRTHDAVRAAERAVAVDANYTLAWANLGTLRREVGDEAGGEQALRRALALDPKQRGAMLGLAGLLRDRSELAPAATLFERAAQIDPRDAIACLYLGQTRAERDDLAGARQAFAEALRRDPSMLRASLGSALALPMVPADGAAASAARASYAEGLASVERELPARARRLAAERMQDELRFSNFLLAYQGEDDKELQARYGALAIGMLRAAAPEWIAPLPRRARGSAKVRVGFLSTFFRDGTVGRYFERWVTDLPRDDFEVFAYHLLPGVDPVAQRIAQRADTFRHCPWWRPSQVAPRVRSDALDVLVYPELGMGAVPFALAAMRLAPLQCAGWGHPVTTGLPAIDVFFSSAVMEPADAVDHYSERLVTLPGIGTRYAAPAAPDDATRAQFGLPPDVPLLLCPQSLFKIHPDNDALFAQVLAAAPDAVLVVFEGRDPVLTARFRDRLARSGVPAARLHVTKPVPHADFLRINSLCDVMLDTLRWSGGNTSLDALACGLPIVTLPGRFMRGRQSFGMLTLMGLPELVARDAADYASKVAAIATNRAHREDLSARIRAAHGRIFDDPAPVSALAEFLRR